MSELPENARRNNCAGHGEEASERQWEVAGMLSETVSEVNRDFADNSGWKHAPAAQTQRGPATLAVHCGRRMMFFRPKSRAPEPIDDELTSFCPALRTSFSTRSHHQASFGR
jgi:hypothetical protein